MKSDSKRKKLTLHDLAKEDLIRLFEACTIIKPTQKALANVIAARLAKQSNDKRTKANKLAKKAEKMRPGKLQRASIFKAGILYQSSKRYLKKAENLLEEYGIHEVT